MNWSVQLPGRLPGMRLVFLTILLGAVVSGAQAQPQIASNPTEDRDRGIQLYQQGKTKDAIVRLRIAAKKNKKDSEAWHYLGLALTRDGQYKEGGKAFEASVKSRETFAPAHAGLAYTLLLRNKLKDALKEAERALALDPNLSDAHYIAGVVQLRTGETQKALDAANAAVRLRPAYARGHLLRSQALVTIAEEILFSDQVPRDKRLATYKEAVDSLEQYLKLSLDKQNDAVWRDQLEAMKATTELFEQTGRTIFRSGEVTERARVLTKPEPAYTESARGNEVTGTVVLRAVFAADGKVKHLSVIRGLPDGLTERAVAAARAIKFVPAKKDGRPVSMWMQLEYNFNLY
jgi:TonB family protein